MKDIIVKIGGKICENDSDLQSTMSQFNDLLFKHEILSKIVIIPGGGTYANLVRKIDYELDVGDNISHWMAIYAMNIQGTRLIEKFPEIEGITKLESTKESKKKKIQVFLPLEYLKETDELPHSWDVTSDSIIVYLASKLGLKECYLIKDVDGIIDNKNQIIEVITVSTYKTMKLTNKLLNPQNNYSLLKQSQPIDNYSLDLIQKYQVSCIFLNGKKEKNSILNYFYESEREKAVYTKITII